MTEMNMNIATIFWGLLLAGFIILMIDIMIKKGKVSRRNRGHILFWISMCCVAMCGFGCF